MSVFYDSASRSDPRRAADDIAEGVGFWRLWSAMGWQDVRNRYRRSVLGPFWLTLSMAILAGSLAVVYGSLFRIEISDYIGYLCIGLSVWSLFSSSFVDGCQVFLGSEYIIKQTRLPYSAYVFRMLWRNIIIFLHNIVIFFMIAIGMGQWPGAIGLLALPGTVLLVCTMAWVSLLLGLACARFRDIPPIIANMTQLLFLITPIMWKPETLGERRFLIDVNPVFHVIEVVRAPLLGQMPSALSWGVALFMTVAGSAITFLIFSRYRRRLPYWL
jgi:ABC-type polysaccharide/polyol phosphate export permease